MSTALDEVDSIATEMFGKPYYDLSKEEQEQVLDKGQSLAEETGGASARSGGVGQQVAGKVAEEGIKYGAKEYVYNPIRDAIIGKGAEAAGTAAAAEGASQLGSGLATEASQLAWNEGANMASQAAWNAGADAATNAAAQGGSLLDSLTPNLASLGPAAMAALVLKSIMLISKDRNKTKNAEEFKAARLANEGAKLPDNILKVDTDNRDDLAADYVGMDKDGNYVNNKFNTSRDEKDLDTEMIMRTGAPYDLFEGDPEAIRRVVDKGRELGAFREQYGQIQSYLTPELEAAAAANGVKLRKGRDQYSLAIGDVNDNKNIYGGIGVADMPTTEKQRAAGNFYSDGYAGGDRERSFFDLQRENQAMDGESPEAMARRLEESKRRSKEAAERLRKLYEDRYNAYLAANGGSKLPVVAPPTTTPKPADVTQPQPSPAVPDPAPAPQPSKEVLPDAPPAKQAQSLYAPMTEDDSSMLDLLNLPGKNFQDQLKEGGRATQVEAQLGRRASEARRGRIGSRRARQ